MPGRLPAKAENGRKRPSVPTTAVPNGTKTAFKQKQWNRLHRSATRHKCRADYRLKPKTGVNARSSHSKKTKAAAAGPKLGKALPRQPIKSTLDYSLITSSAAAVDKRLHRKARRR